MTFNGIDASIFTEQHIKNFSRHCGSYVRGVDKHEDVYMTLFALSLDGKVENWYDNLPNNSFTTIADFKTAFLGKFGSNKEPRHLVAALTSMKKSETETMDEFNNRFTELSNSIPTTYAPPAASTLDYYIEALSGKIQYQIRDKEPTTLLLAQGLAIKIDKNMQSSGESNIQGYSRSSTPLKTVELKGKESSNEAYEKKLVITRLVVACLRWIQNGR